MNYGNTKGWSPKRIAAYLREQAHELYKTGPGGLGRVRIQIPGTRLTVSCPNRQDALLAMAARFEKGYKRNRVSYGDRSPRGHAFSITAFESFMRDGEYENAKNYVRLTGIPEKYRKHPAVLELDDYILNLKNAA